jgi:hypothetical protein
MSVLDSATRRDVLLVVKFHLRITDCSKTVYFLEAGLMTSEKSA